MNKLTRLINSHSDLRKEIRTLPINNDKKDLLTYKLDIFLERIQDAFEYYNPGNDEIRVNLPENLDLLLKDYPVHNPPPNPSLSIN